MAKPWEIVDLNPDDPLKISLRRTLLGWMQEMLSYEPETIKGTDPEALHNMRVSARRLRATLKIHRDLFPKKQLRHQLEEIEKLITVFGPVREIDVFLEELEKLITEIPTQEKGALQWLVAQERTIRELHRKIMKAEIRQLMRTGFKHRFEEFIWGSLHKKGTSSEKRTTLRSNGREILPPILDSFLDRIYLVILNEHHQEPLHALRLRGKRVRYAMEIYAPAYHEPFADCLASVKEILGILGRIHDIDINLPILRQHVRQVRHFNAGMNDRSLKISTAGIRVLIQRFEKERHDFFLSLCKRFSQWENEQFRQRYIQSISAT